MIAFADMTFFNLCLIQDFIKLINPIRSNVNYDNKGSCSRLMNYLSAGERLKGEKSIFFGEGQERLSKEEVREAIDNNVKGLAAFQEKFTSVVIAPNENEIGLIRDHPELERQFIALVMKAYASNFHLKHPIGQEDLVWFAIRHDARHYKSEDKEVISGKARQGDVKPGSHPAGSGDNEGQKG